MPETDASLHDSQELDEILDKSNTSTEVWVTTAAIKAKVAPEAIKSELTDGAATGRFWRGCLLLSLDTSVHACGSAVRVAVELAG